MGQLGSRSHINSSLRGIFNVTRSPFCSSSHRYKLHNLQKPNKKKERRRRTSKMGALLKLIDAVLFVFFMVIALAAPLIDAQTCLPLSLFPDLLLDLKNWYAREYGDYLIAEKPDFFVGIVWLELFFQWPLALLNLYAILARKPWFNTTCLIYGASCLTSMVTILSELIGSHKASDKLLMMYFPFLGFGVLAILRGLMPHSGRTTSTIGKRPLLGRKKRV
ncbi:hypothetical protein ACJW30_06G096800 [Castanea mollissima]